jgi:murein L,D-transpeptidase YcbB/YkuD
MGLGDDSMRVAALRSRLGLAEGTLFNKAVEIAVLAFQRSRRLSSDGRVGKQTLAALNIGPKQRIETLRVNLERARWLRDIGLDDKFIAVNIAGFRVYLFENGKISWQTRAVVGKTYHKTPLFTAKMKYLVLNPTWTPTPNILRNETVPKARKDPGYLDSKNYAVFDKSGNRVDPRKADWSNYRQYRIVQQPGPGNALGRVKFIFPNKHFVYLHDTPSRNLFGEKSRAFSHGCIRTENPLELARRLLADQNKWTPEAIERVLKTGRTATVHLRKPMPVFLLYWTANPLREGAEIEYLPDVYGRDGAILKALDRPFSAGRN